MDKIATWYVLQLGGFVQLFVNPVQKTSAIYRPAAEARAYRLAGLFKR